MWNDIKLGTCTWGREPQESFELDMYGYDSSTFSMIGNFNLLRSLTIWNMPVSM